MSELIEIDSTTPTLTVDAALSVLNEKQAEFVRRYVIDKNASQAARDAGYSVRNAGKIGHKLTLKPTIQAAIEAFRAELVNSGTANPAELVSRLRAQALGSPLDFLERYLDEESGAELWRYKTPDKLNPEQRAMVASVSINTRRLSNGSVRQTISYKTIDGQRALEQLARVLGMNVDKVQHDHQHGGQVSHAFAFVAAHPEHSETTRRIGAAGSDGRRRPVTFDQAPE
jgi:phage terminase small subunit